MEIQILDQDCLLYIFKFISIFDIINLQKSSPMFNDAIEIYYRRVKKIECNMRYIQLEKLINVLEKIGPYLTSFKYTGGLVMQKEYKRSLVMAISTNCKNLKRFALNYVPLEKSDLMVLMIVTENLETLDFGNCSIRDADLYYVLSKTHYLKQLILNGNSMLTGECLHCLNNLQKLDISYCYALTTENLCKYLKCCKTLSSLNVSACYMLNCEEVVSVLVESSSHIEELLMENLGASEMHLPYEKIYHLRVLEIKGNRLGT